MKLLGGGKYCNYRKKTGTNLTTHQTKPNDGNCPRVAAEEQA
jgi:hypothetical protein